MKMFWNKEIETAPVKKLRELQLELLKSQLERVYSRSRYYRRKFDEAGVHPSDIQNLVDIADVPFTSRVELEKNFEDILSVPFTQVSGIRQTSGTSGSPLTVAFTEKDKEAISEAYARKLAMYGVTEKDVIQVTGAYGLWQGAWSVHWGSEKVGATVIPTGPGDTERQIRLIKRFGTTVLYAVTNYHFRILEVAKQLGEDLRSTNLRLAICVGEKPTSNQVETLKKTVGYESVMIDYGATEFPGFSVHCTKDPQTHHVWADYYLIESVDPETHEPIKEGERGEIVITSLQREAFPLIRYLSRDVTDFYGFHQCGCGLSHPKIGVNIDRQDYMIKVRGTTIFPTEVEFVLEKHRELTGQYQIIVDKRTPKQSILINMEMSHEISEVNENLLRQRIAKEMKAATGVTINSLNFVPSGHFEGKPKRMLVLK